MVALQRWLSGTRLSHRCPTPRTVPLRHCRFFRVLGFAAAASDYVVSSLKHTHVHSPEPVMVSNERVSNNYTRTGGQNVGNFMTERPTSRVLDQPGGKSQICLGYVSPRAVAWLLSEALSVHYSRLKH